jgi:hypothetical protein
MVEDITTNTEPVTDSMRYIFRTSDNVVRYHIEDDLLYRHICGKVVNIKCDSNIINSFKMRYDNDKMQYDNGQKGFMIIIRDEVDQLIAAGISEDDI